MGHNPAQAATSTIPIVFAIGADPIGSKPETARRQHDRVTFLSTELTGKRLDLLREIAPSATTVVYTADKQM
jgi:ABC-type uncharacterized transport system substrate-binding protein